MKILRLVSLLVLPPTLALGLVAPTVAPGTAAGPGAAPAPPTAPTLVANQAAHHPGFDRIVYRFRGGLPESHEVHYVKQLLGDASGLPVRISGRAVLQAVFKPAVAHEDGDATVPSRIAFGLPNILTTVRAGDNEGVVTYGIGLAKQTPIHVFTLTKPPRVVVDVRAGFRTVNRPVYFFDRDNFVNAHEPYFRAVSRPIRADRPGVGVLDSLFAGPKPGERANGLRLLRSHATGFKRLAIKDHVARVTLKGGCSSGGSTVTVAGEIMPTLRRLPSVDWVKIYDPSGHTEHPKGHTDSIPACLEP